jgi:O-antigen/teichoic acid export membrane protein
VMSKIRKQSILNTIWSYTGIFAGALYTIFIVPKAFHHHPEQWGLVQFLVYYTQVFLPLAAFGIPINVIRFFSKVEKKLLPQFYFFSISIVLGLTAVVSIFYLYFGTTLANKQNELLFITYYKWLVPMLVGAVFFESFSAFSRAALKSNVPVFLKETVSKFWTLAILTLYYFKLFSFDVFIGLYAALYIFQLLAMISYLVKEHAFTLKFNISFFGSPIARKMYPYMLVSILGASAAIWTSKVDVLMIGYLLDLQQVAYYTIALYIATLIIIPYRSMASIATPMIAGYWTSNDVENINKVYKKVSIVSLVGGSFIFLAIWLNIEWIMNILGDKFGNTSWVFFLLGLSKLIDASFGINGGILLTSKYFKYDLIFQLLLITVTIVLNFVLIPVYKLEGAAASTLIALLTYNAIKVMFLYYKSGLFPFTKHTMKVLFLIIGVAVLTYIIPATGSHWEDAILNILVLTGLYLAAIWYWDISADLKSQILAVKNFLF